MKSFFIAIIVASISTMAFSFECKSPETGIIYKVNSTKKTITVRESNGKLIVTEPYSKVSIKYLETSPAMTKYSYFNKYGILMEVKVQGRKVTGSFDNDENLVCTK